MMDLLLHIAIKMAILAAVLMMPGILMYGFFRDLGVKRWRALVPFYNLVAWLRIFRYPGWLIIPILMPWWLPSWWSFVLALMIVVALIYRTVGLYRSVGKRDIDRSRLFEKKLSYENRVMSKFRANRPARFSLWILGIIMLLASHAPYIANDQPLMVKYKGETFYPAWVSVVNPTKTYVIEDLQTGEKEILQFDIIEWRSMETEEIVWPLIAYDDNFQDKYNRNYTGPNDKQMYKTASGELSELPGRLKHPLGTDQAGRDVAAGLLYGSRYSLIIGIVAMGIAGLIGVLLGSIGGYFGDRGWHLSRIQMILGAIGLFFGYFYGFVAREWHVSEALDQSLTAGMMTFAVNLSILLATPLIFVLLAGKMRGRGWLSKKINMPVDAAILRLIEIFNSIPRLLLVIVIAAVVNEPSIWLVMSVIGLTAWTGIARFTRAEMFRIREMDYIEAARALGYTNREIIFRHALPNAMGPVFVSLAFGIAGAILVESGLSFLGIGVPQDIVTWGSLLNAGRQSFDSWWLIVFPGLAIFITITCFNLVGDGLRDALDVKSK